MADESFHNFQVLRGLSSNRSLLSCTSAGKVDLFSTDDGSGRQRWYIVPVTGFPEVYNIKVQGGTDPGKTFLSCTADGEKVDLFSHDDGSGRQRWRFVAVSGSPICSYHNILVVGGVNNGRIYLSCTADGTKVDLIKEDDGSGRQRWQTQ